MIQYWSSKGLKQASNVYLPLLYQRKMEKKLKSCMILIKVGWQIYYEAEASWKSLGMRLSCSLLYWRQPLLSPCKCLLKLHLRRLLGQAQLRWQRRGIQGRERWTSWGGWNSALIRAASSWIGVRYTCIPLNHTPKFWRSLEITVADTHVP